MRFYRFRKGIVTGFIFLNYVVLHEFQNRCRAEGALTESANVPTSGPWNRVRADIIYWMFRARYRAVAAGKPIFFIAELERRWRELFKTVLEFCGDSFFVFGISC